MKDTGDAIMGMGEGIGENRVADAVDQAIHNALLEENSIQGASSLLINVTGGQDMTLHEWNEVSQIITTQVDSNANIIIGLNEDETLKDRIRVTVIATGFRARLPHSFNTIKKDSVQQMNPGQNKEIPKSKPMSQSDQTESNEPSRSIKSPLKPNAQFNYSEDYDIPAYLRRGNRD
jgi:cell division protein FtsZ